MVDTESVLMVPGGKGCEEMGEEVKGLRSTNWQLQNSPGDVKYSTKKIGTTVIA